MCQIHAQTVDTKGTYFSLTAFTQIAFRRRTDVGPTSAHPSVRRWANGFLTVGPTLAQRRQANAKNYILCTASANQICSPTTFLVRIYNENIIFMSKIIKWLLKIFGLTEI